MIDFTEIDKLLNGDSHEKTKAYGLLLELYEKVRIYIATYTFLIVLVISKNWNNFFIKLSKLV